MRRYDRLKGGLKEVVSLKTQSGLQVCTEDLATETNHSMCVYMCICVHVYMIIYWVRFGDTEKQAQTLLLRL